MLVSSLVGQDHVWGHVGQGVPALETSPMSPGRGVKTTPGSHGESTKVLEQTSRISPAFHSSPCCCSGLVQGPAPLSPGAPWGWTRDNVVKDNVATFGAICIVVCKFMSTFKLKEGKIPIRAFLGSFLNGNVCRRFNISHKLKKIHLVPEMLYNILRREAGENIA